MSGEEDGFRFFLRHEKEGDGADDDDDDSDEDEHDGEQGGISSPQGQISRIEVIAQRTLPSIHFATEMAPDIRPAPFGREFRNEAMNISFRIAPFYSIVSRSLCRKLHRLVRLALVQKYARGYLTKI